MDKQKKGNLYLIPTILAPSTTSTVIVPQVNALVSSLNYYIVENAKTARRFISALQLNISIEELSFFELNKRTDYKDIPEMLKPIFKGFDMAILSEAGVPCIADPGSRVVSMAHQNNIKVIPIVGPSSILLAIMASGFNGQQFTFHGYIPIDKRERQKKLRKLEQEVIITGYTQVFMETPYRNDKLLSDILTALMPDTKLCIASNLTAHDEYVKTQKVKDWKKTQMKIGKAPAVFLLGI